MQSRAPAASDSADLATDPPRPRQGCCLARSTKSESSRQRSFDLKELSIHHKSQCVADKSPLEVN